MVYFHSIDYVLGRDPDRNAWRAYAHLPRTMFPKKNAKRVPKDNRKKDYPFFKRMINLLVRETVFNRHREMLRLYQKYCEEAEEEP